MKIAISATGPTLEAEVDLRFGRCQYFIIVDLETMEFEAMDNSGALASGGAGTSVAQMIAGKGVQAVLTGNCGPNAYQVLAAAGIQVVTGIAGKVRDTLESYKAGKFQASSQPNVPGHFGIGRGMDRSYKDTDKGTGRCISKEVQLCREEVVPDPPGAVVRVQEGVPVEEVLVSAGGEVLP